MGMGFRRGTRRGASDILDGIRVCHHGSLEMGRGVRGGA